MSRDFQQTHENLLLCAQKHFLEYGFERASIREICKDAHVTNGAFYNHFDDKEALFDALVEPVVQEVKAIYEASVNEHMELAKITTRGQITLPLEIRKKLKVGEGDKVVFYEDNGRIVVENAAKLAFAQVREDFKGEAERLGLETEQDIVNMVKEVRQQDKQ